MEYERKKDNMKITSYVRPYPDINYAEYLKSQMYDIYGGGEITYIEDSPPHINHGSLRINGNIILFNYIDTILNRSSFKARKWSWDYSGFTIDMWIKPISYNRNTMLMIFCNREDAGIRANLGYITNNGENWNWDSVITIDSINAKGVPHNKWNRLTICSDEDNKKLYVFVNGKLQLIETGSNFNSPKFYMGGLDPWNGGGYCQFYLNEIYVTPEVRFTKEFDPYKKWIDFHSIYTNPDAYGIRKKDDSE